ncbi:MAG: filamentous hemagglutinin N-terminal domain-containing protein [Opitutaceae bacterium]|nr:filamentous hemagglutinin N-terminal domain-containing protein [Opitutaceae bacterium]
MLPALRKFSGIFTSLAMLAGFGVASLRAQPSGGRVTAGGAVITGSAGAVTITQATDRAIIDWQAFSSRPGEMVRFIQPDAASATLNRVLSGETSVLDGALEANGRIFLINPNGILIGAGARIDTAGFVASTLDVANTEFLAAGDLHFSGDSSAAVVNLGSIDAAQGDVFLIARQVENKGTVTAANGTAGLAAGSEVLLTTGGGERLFVQAASSPGTVVNAGELRAAAAELKAAGGNAYALAINNSGLIRATGGEVRAGQIWLIGTGESTVTNAGTLDASSATAEGGRIAVTGGRVLLDDGARLDARGATGGGEILVFGGAQAGGQVTVGGALDASSTGGDGGFIETSATRVQVTDGARVTTSALNGRNGLWLIDPVDFTIAASGGDMTGAAVGAALAGGNFAVQSTTGSSGTAGDVNVNDTISWSANTLTLNAQNNINLNAVMNGSGTASLALEYGQGAVAAGNTSNYVVKAAINLPAGNNFSTKLGSDGAVKNFTVITSLGAAGSTTTTDLQGIAGGLAGNYVLGMDIDASTTSGWNAGAGFAPIGTTGARYTGTLDGLGHTVSGLTISRPAQNDVGLFGYLGVGGVLRNIRLSGGTVTGNTGTGSLLGSNSGSVSYASASTTVSGFKNVGGLIGGSLGPITNVSATGNVSNVSGGGGFIGGLVGNSATGGTITNGWASGNVTATGPNAGGLVGFNTTAILSNTYATGSVSGTNLVGGLVGSGAGHINNSYATGTTTGSGSYVGGLVGNIYAGSTVTNSYATGSVSGTNRVGGLVGSNDGTVTNSYWDSTVTATGIGFGTTVGATGLTNAAMKAQASFAGFDVSATAGSSSVWRIYEGNTTPWLRVFLTPLTVTANDATKTYNGSAYSGGNGVTYSIASPSPTPAGTLIFTGTAAGAVNAGSYTLTASGLYSVQQGYDISYAPGTLTINKADLALTGTRVYNSATNFAGSNLTATGVNGETFTVTGAGALGNLSTKNVQTDQLLASVTGLALGVGNSGAAIASNYNALSTVNSSVSVTPAPLTIYGFAAEDKVYDGNTTAVITTPGTLSGIVGEGEDDVGFTHTDATFDTKDVGTAKTVTLNGVTLNGADKINYTYTAVTTEQSDITPATLTYTADLASRTYGASDPAFTGTVTGFAPGETVANATTGTAAFTTTATVTSNVGTYAIYGSGLTANHDNYDFEQADGNATALTINPANLVLTGTRIYDGTTFFAGGNLTATGVLGETFTVTGAGDATNLATKNVQTSQLLASVGGLALGTSGNGGLASNYHALSVTDSEVSVTPTNLTVSTSDVIKVYDGTTSAVGSPVILAGQLFGSDALASGLLGPTYAFVGKDVGSGNKTVTIAGLGVNDGNSGNNYTLTLADNTTSTINPYAVNLTGTRAYDGTVNVAAGIFNFGTLVGSETLTLSGTGTVALKDVSVNQTVNVTGLTLGDGTGLASNYTFTGGTQIASITPADLILSGTRVYDGTTIFAGSNLTATGVNGETFTVSGAGAVGNLASQHVQTNQTLASVGGLALGTSGNGGLASNYHALSTTGSQVSVTPAALTVTANNAAKTYGQTTTFGGTEFTSSGLVPGETIGSVSLTSSGAVATASVAGSPYAIMASAATGGTFNPANYTLSYVNGVLTVTDAVTPPPVTNVPLTITADNKAMTFGGPLPVFTASFNGFINGDRSASVTGLQFSTTATIGSNVGTYTITPFGATAPSYSLVGYVPGVLTIHPALLTITANDVTRPFGATTPGFTAGYAGFVNGNTASVVSGLAFSTVATNSPDDFTIIPGGATAQNYTIVYVNGLLHILMPVVPVGGNDVPVLVIDGEPLSTPKFAVIEQNGHPVFVSLGEGSTLPPGDQLVITLGEATNPPVDGSIGPGMTGFTLTGGPNFGNFEPVAASGGSGAETSQTEDPGLFREISLNQGGFNIVYHEPADEARQQDGENASTGSSYREFPNADNPQVNLVRSKVGRKPGEPAAGGTGGGAL